MDVSDALTIDGSERARNGRLAAGGRRSPSWDARRRSPQTSA